MSTDEPTGATNGADPSYAQALARAQVGDLSGAEGIARAVLTHRATHGPTLLLLGNLARQRGDFAAAIAWYRQGATADPDDPDARRNLAFALADTGQGGDAQSAEAVRMLRQIAQDETPVARPVLVRLVSALLGLGRAEEACQWLDGRDATEPDAELLFLKGNANYAVGNFAGAAAAYGLAAELAADPAIHSNLGNALKAMGRFDEAIAAYRQALATAPDLVGAWAGLGDALEERKHYDQAREAYQTALKLDPDHAEVDSTLLHLNLKTARWDGLDAHIARVERAVERGQGLVSPFSFMITTDKPHLQHLCSQRWCEVRYHHISPAFSHDRPRAPGPIRIGYLAGGFRRHPMAHLLSEVFELHDRAKFEIFGYSHGPDDGSDERRRMAGAMGRFRDVRALSHHQIAQTIYDDSIDILIDRDGHTEGARTEICALRPAPVQVSYLVFAATMGAPFIDYALLDPWVVPKSEQRWFSEQIVHLPHCYQPNDRKRPVAARTPSRAECGLPDDAVVFCCFNGTQKIRPQVFDLWMNILGQVPGSVMWLLADSAEAQANLKSRAGAHGMDPARLVFAERCPIDQHLARHRLADLFLDTLPYNAHTTASDALWMGCPVVTMKGRAFAGRVAASIVHAVGLADLVVGSAAEYQALAVKLARDPRALAAVRARLAEGVRTAPLFDTPLYVRHLESALRTMHDRAQRGLPAQGFAVDA